MSNPRLGWARVGLGSGSAPRLWLANYRVEVRWKITRVHES